MKSLQTQGKERERRPMGWRFLLVSHSVGSFQSRSDPQDNVLFVLSANWQPGAKRVLNQPRRGGGKEESWVSRLKPAKEAEPGGLYIAQGGHRWMEPQARSEKEKDLCSVQTKGQKKNHQSGWAALQ